jgi:hypothetical protein
VRKEDESFIFPSRLEGGRLETVRRKRCCMRGEGGAAVGRHAFEPSVFSLEGQQAGRACFLSRADALLDEEGAKAAGNLDLLLGRHAGDRLKD